MPRDSANVEPIPEEIRRISAAMDRAAERARRVAVQTNTPLVLVRDGKVVHVSPEPDRLQGGTGKKVA
jgi:hypothetical protein